MAESLLEMDLSFKGYDAKLELVPTDEEAVGKLQDAMYANN